jgi:hypothetical protein
MPSTLEELEKRVEALEREVTTLRAQAASRPAEETAAERGARMLREARANQAALSAAVARAFAEMGITGEPVGHEKLQEMMLACDVNPEDNASSREIIAMRKE